MSNTLAVPSFVGGAKDSLATVDVYSSQAGGAVINNIQPITAVPTSSGALDLRGGKNMMGDLANTAGTISSVQNLLTAGNPMSRLIGVNPSLAKGLSALSIASSVGILGNVVGNASNVLGTAGAIAGAGMSIVATVEKDISAVKGVVNAIKTVSRQLKAGNVTDIRMIATLIQNISTGQGCSPFMSVTDTGAQNNALSGLINVAAGLGIPNAFGALMCAACGIVAINSVARNSLPTVIKTGDFGSLQSMANQTSPGMLYATNPSVCSQAAGTYQNSYGSTSAGNITGFNDITSTFGVINPSWNTSPRVTSTGTVDNAINITALQNASPDCNSCMSAGVANAAPTDYVTQSYALAQVYPPTDVATQIQTQFPNTVVTPGNNTTPNSLDPRVLNTTSSSQFGLTSTVSSNTTTVSGGGSTTQTLVGPDGSPVTSAQLADPNFVTHTVTTYTPDTTNPNASDLSDTSDADIISPNTATPVTESSTVTTVPTPTPTLAAGVASSNTVQSAVSTADGGPGKQFVTTIVFSDNTTVTITDAAYYPEPNNPDNLYGYRMIGTNANPPTSPNNVTNSSTWVYQGVSGNLIPVGGGFQIIDMDSLNEWITNFADLRTA